jgi:hypothetical protein
VQCREIKRESRKEGSVWWEDLTRQRCYATNKLIPSSFNSLSFSRNLFDLSRLNSLCLNSSLFFISPLCIFFPPPLLSLSLSLSLSLRELESVSVL